MTMPQNRLIPLAATLFGFCLLMADIAIAQDKGVRAGFLRCDVEGNLSFIFGSSRDVECTYVPDAGGREDKYRGTITQYGIDIGYQSSGVILWAVIAPSSDIGPGALSGKFAGVAADIAAGFGVGANALLGGSGRSIALQPLSVEGIKGINIAAGIAGLQLKAQ